MNFFECVDWLKTMLEIPVNDEDANFTRILPAMFLYAEGRIYRELDFLPTTNIGQLDGLVQKGVRQFPLPTNIVALRQLSVIVPNTTDSKRRSIPLERISPEALNMFWPQESLKLGVPKKYAIIGQVQATPTPPPPPPPQGTFLEHLVLLMPTPDKPYTMAFMGRIMPQTISATNPDTYLSFTYPELLLTACMVFGAGYQRDFGAQADDPAKAMSWEAQYQTLKNGIMLEAARMRGEVGWTPMAPMPAAPPGAA